MQLREKKMLLSLVFVAIFVTSTVFAVSSLGIVPSEGAQVREGQLTYESPNVPSQEESGTNVWWNQDSNSSESEWSHTSKNWLFGPKPSFEIFHENGSLLTSNSYAEIDEVIRFVVRIPKDILEGAGIGAVKFNGWFMTADWNFSAGFDFGYENWEWTSEPWNAYSYQYNYTDEGGTPLPSFVDILPAQCSNTTDANNYFFTLSIRFTSDTPIGLYELHLHIVDTDQNHIGTYGFGGHWQFEGIAVGIHPDLAWSYSYGGSYTLEKLDLTGDVLYSVSRLTDFKMRFSIIGENPEWVLLSFYMPGGMRVPVNRTGWHRQLQTSTGGWVFDEDIQTYVWDAGREVKTYVDVYGPYTDYEWTEVGQYEQVNVTVLREVWNETSQTYDRYLEEQTQWVQKVMFYIYNFTSESFEEYYGYSYWGYPYEEIEPNTWNEEVYVFEPIPTDLPIFYELNVPASSVQTVGQEILVDFVGHFTERMPKTDQYSSFWFETRVFGSDHEFYPDIHGDTSRQTEQEFGLAKTIVIESPVTIAKLLRADGTEPRGWMFQVDHGADFTVMGRLQGGSEIADDIDGVSFTMEAYDSFWSEESYRWSNLQFVVEITTDGTATYRAFNMTQKYNYTYGTYMDYVLVDKTGWYYHYNSSTNTWTWVYGDYQQWEWAEVEGWHWQHWSFNQITQKWQKEWIGHRSAEAAVPANFGVASSYKNWTSGGDLYANFTFTTSLSMPETSYWWNFAFMNNTWYEDYSSGWGDHEVMDWGIEWVHSFLYDGTRVYVDTWNDNQLAYQFQNGSLAGELAVGKESPYIVIDGENYPIKVRENYDPWSGYVWTSMFFYDHYDPATGKDVYRYELTNGTEILVTNEETFVIYNVTTSTADSFLTAQKWHRYYYDGTDEWAYWIDINGAIHIGPYSVYSIGNLAYHGIHDHVEKTPHQPWLGFVVYGTSATVLNIVDLWWSSRDETYYMTSAEGEMIPLIYNSVTYNYEIYINDAWQRCTWPEQYFVEDYMGSEAILVTYETQKFWFTTIGDVQYEMPYPNAHARWHWELDNTDVDYGKVPTTRSLIWDGMSYPVRNISLYDNGNVTTYDYVRIDGEDMEVWETWVPYVRVNGTDIWYPDRNGFSGYVGTYDENLVFTKLDDLIVEYGNMTPFDPYPRYSADEDSYYFQLNNGTTWLVNKSHVLSIFEYDLDGKAFYSIQEWPDYQQSGNLSWYEYIALNGTVYKLKDWRQLPILNTFSETTFHNGSSYHFSFQGEDYEFQYGGRWKYTYIILNATYAGDLYFFWEYDSNSVKPILSFNYRGEDVDAVAHNQAVLRLRYRWGHALKYGLQPIDSTVYKNYQSFVVGTPRWGMWGLKNWAINPDNGALDLDGNLDTTDDQYFVREEYQSYSTWTHEWDFMSVSVNWDPNTTLYGDEMNIHSWLGLNTFTWSYEWNQSFYWYSADDFSPLNASEMQDVIDTLLNPEGEARAGYWDIAWMAKNVTWEDILAEAIENGWDWVSSNTQSWTWLTFAIDQNYGVSYETEDVFHWLDVGLHYEFSGLMLWEDKNMNGLMDVDLINPGSGELTHYLIPESVGGVSFVTPGEAYGDFSSSGSLTLDIEDEVTWGVTFSGINGTVYPFNLYGYWGWYDRMTTGSDMRSFDERPTKVAVDELSFLVHFQGELDPEGLNNKATIKVDNYVGNWVVHMTGGRSNLANRSLALNYFSDIRMSNYAFKVNGSFTDSESTVSADTFEFETAGAKFAEMIMGGVTYDWSKNTTSPYDVVSQTTPVGTFRAAFESESGQSATAWSFSSSMYYVTIGFPQWEGYSVYQDPAFVSYVSNRGTTSVPGGPVTFGAFSVSPTVPSASDTVDIGIDIFTSSSIHSVELIYWTDTTSPSSTGMWEESSGRWVGSIPPFADGTQVYYKVVVHTDEGAFESQIGSYIVGQGVVTTTDTPTDPTGGIGLPIDLIVLLGGIGVVVVLLVLISSRRRK